MAICCPGSESIAFKALTFGGRAAAKSWDVVWTQIDSLANEKIKTQCDRKLWLSDIQPLEAEVFKQSGLEIVKSRPCGIEETLKVKDGTWEQYNLVKELIKFRSWHQDLQKCKGEIAALRGQFVANTKDVSKGENIASKIDSLLVLLSSKERLSMSRQKALVDAITVFSEVSQETRSWETSLKRVAEEYGIKLLKVSDYASRLNLDVDKAAAKRSVTNRRRVYRRIADQATRQCAVVTNILDGELQVPSSQATRQCAVATNISDSEDDQLLSLIDGILVLLPETEEFRRNHGAGIQILQRQATGLKAQLQQIRSSTAAKTADKNYLEQQMNVLKEAHQRRMDTYDVNLQAMDRRGQSDYEQGSLRAVTQAQTALKQKESRKKRLVAEKKTLGEDITRRRAALDQRIKSQADLRSISLADAKEEATSNLLRDEEKAKTELNAVFSRLQALKATCEAQLGDLERNLQRAKAVMDEEGRDRWICDGTPPPDDLQAKRLIELYKAGRFSELYEYKSAGVWTGEGLGTRYNWLAVTVERRRPSMASQKRVQDISKEKETLQRNYNTQTIDLQKECDMLQFTISDLNTKRRSIEQRFGQQQVSLGYLGYSQAPLSTKHQKTQQELKVEFERKDMELQNEVDIFNAESLQKMEDVNAELEQLEIEIPALQASLNSLIKAGENIKPPKDAEYTALEEVRGTVDMDFTNKEGELQTKIHKLTSQLEDLTVQQADKTKELQDLKSNIQLELNKIQSVTDHAKTTMLQKYLDVIKSTAFQHFDTVVPLRSVKDGLADIVAATNDEENPEHVLSLLRLVRELHQLVGGEGSAGRLLQGMGKATLVSLIRPPRRQQSALCDDAQPQQHGASAMQHREADEVLEVD